MICRDASPAGPWALLIRNSDADATGRTFRRIRLTKMTLPVQLRVSTRSFLLISHGASGTGLRTDADANCELRIASVTEAY
jgi:hypothetical protein